MPTLQATRHHHWSYLTRGLHHTTTTPPGINNTVFSPVLDLCPEPGSETETCFFLIKDIKFVGQY